MALEEMSVLIHTVHPDQRLAEKARWFQRQPGIRWLERPARRAERAGLTAVPGANPSGPGETPCGPRANSSGPRETPCGPGATPSDPAELKITRTGVFLTVSGESLYFHPSMALLRLLNIERGEPDRFLEACGLGRGDSLFDATLGLGSDALVGAWAVGSTGSVRAVERSGILAALVGDGLNDLRRTTAGLRKSPEKERAWAHLREAAGRIEAHWGDHLEELRKMPAQAVDVVYFDPMFRHTRSRSAAIQPLQRWAEKEPLSRDSVREACRVARKRVVMKERKGSPEFERLGFEVFPGGRYSSVDFGIVDLR
ncbi:Ribosomal RNA small subunit methyltransferase J [Acididesulfobacillus acetoxydans]|uniref:Ribosomal RNA small subunit methyltransferase J n=1 Tax=Acididesulfobacillus acetoxydans TaxID=1561005 RepID=A0A8S0XC32_9FIRM|nr:class I SAM-dependent methyltransferase [Acididesulfobacillus acetoxydans]CAA7601936.1 Ribosomal RNA small subunit methyltransferase J [Acididesulfobacillus acetoxydans]CEJ08220.1 SAM-dependent methyltransferase, tRNA(Uracil-5)-methyltransferase [Acididesulfobacillus acetoxydans]